MQAIILLSGPVGAGKTTVAKKLVEISPGPVACIEGDKFWPFFAKGAEGFGMKKNFGIAMASMTAAAIPFARAGYATIIDFSVTPKFLDKAKAIASAKEVPLHFVIIRPSLAVCIARAAARTEGAIENYTPYMHLYSLYDGYERYMLQGDKDSADIMAAKIRAGLDEGEFLVT